MTTTCAAAAATATATTTITKGIYTTTTGANLKEIMNDAIRDFTQLHGVGHPPTTLPRTQMREIGGTPQGRG